MSCFQLLFSCTVVAVSLTAHYPATDVTGDEFLSRDQANIGRSRIVGLTSLLFIILQSVCTAVIAISGLRLLIGLGALAAGLGRTVGAFHVDAIRIPMMVIAVGGSLINLFVIWRIRSLRARKSSTWRAHPIANETIRSERVQIAIAILTLVLVVAESGAHVYLHRG